MNDLEQRSYTQEAHDLQHQKQDIKDRKEQITEQNPYAEQEKITTREFAEIENQKNFVIDWWIDQYAIWKTGPNNYPRYNDQFQNNEFCFEIINTVWKQWVEWVHEAVVTSHGWIESRIKYEHGWRVLVDCWWNNYLQFWNMNEIHNALYAWVQLALLANYLKSQIKWWKDIFARWYQVLHDRTWPINELLIWSDRMKWLLEKAQGTINIVRYEDNVDVYEAEWSFSYIDKKTRYWSGPGRDDNRKWDTNWFNRHAVRFVEALVTNMAP